MRTNIELDDDLLNEASMYAAVKSKRGIVAEALATYVAVKEQERRRATYRDRLREIRKQTEGIKLSRSSREIIRSDRDKE